MKEQFDDAVCLMLDEIDQIIVEGLRGEPEYLACLDEYHALTEKIGKAAHIPELERWLTLSALIGDMERRAALLRGMEAGTGFRQILDGSNRHVLEQFLSSDFLSEIRDKQ